MKKKVIKICSVAVIAAIVLAITAYLAALFFYRPSYVKSTDTFDVAETAYGEEITVMSFNVRYMDIFDCGKKSWYYRAGLVLGTIKEEQPDVIGFQEMTTTHEQYLTERLKGYAFACEYRDNSAMKEATAIAYRTDRFELKEKGHFWLSKTPEAQSKDWGAEKCRDANYVVLKEKNTGKEFAYFNTHLDARSEEARINGAKVLINKANEFDMPKIITGDFNDKEGSETYGYVTEQAGFSDARIIAERATLSKENTTYTGYGKAKDMRIDYLFAKDGVTVKSYKENDEKPGGDYPSDHYPLVVKIAL